MASRSATSAVKPLVIPADSVSAILVKVSPGSEAQGVATLIANSVPGVSASTGPRMFGTFRSQMTAVLKGLMAIVGIALGLSLVFIALVSTMAAHERRREIGVLRSLGATRPAIVASQVIQALAVTLAGGLVGVGGAALGIWLFRDLIVKSLGFPFLYPPLSELTLLAAEGLLVIVTGVALAVALPATAAALQEPATAMRD
jgi:putative ABC transport system permease protein